jgi:thiol-disulfide isomerase/thioredoxin
VVIMALVAVLAAGSGYWVARLLSPATGANFPAASSQAANARAISPPADLVGQPRPDFRLRDESGRVLSAEAFDGRVFLVNFWATWCAPCVDEMPMLSELHRDYAGQNFAIVGIALDDPERAQEFARELQVEYPVLFGRADAMLVGRRYGNREGMLPYSVLVDAGGIIRWTRLGMLQRAEVEAQLAALR